MTMIECDLCIIGAGPAGYSGALRAARSGMKVALVERDRLGGTCLNRGCIPTKALRRCADALLDARESARFGVTGAAGLGFDYGRAAAHRDASAQTLVAGVEALVKAAKITVVKGEARVEPPGRVVVAGAEGAREIGWKQLVLATGARPADLPGLAIDEDRILSSEGALRLNALPSSLIIVGAGVIGFEWADLLSSFGVKVMVVETLARGLINEDRATAVAVQKSLARRGVEFYFSTTIAETELADPGVRCKLSDGTDLAAERMIVSVGRRPVTEGLGLERLGVSVERGAIKVDGRGRTSAAEVWAAGDVIGPPMLAHAASHEMEVVVENILDRPREFDRAVLPAVVFVRPEVASVGLLEDRAKESKMAVDVGRFGYAASGKAVCLGETEGMAKVITAKDGGKILGATVIGAHAGDLIHEAAAAIKAGMTVYDLTEMIHAHPTLSEIILEATADAKGMALHKIRR